MMSSYNGNNPVDNGITQGLEIGSEADTSINIPTQ